MLSLSLQILERHNYNEKLVQKAAMFLTGSRSLIFGGPVIVRWIRDPWTEKSLFAAKWELMKPTRKPSIRLVSETGIFLWILSLLLSFGPLLSLLCLAWARHGLCDGLCHGHHLFLGMVDWCASRLVRLIYGHIILTASRPGSLLICRSHVDLPLSYTYHCLQV